MTSATKLTYQPYSSILNPGFWQHLTSVKLNRLKLSEEPIDICGSYSCNLSPDLPCLASFDHSSYNVDQYNQLAGNKSTCPLYGKLICMNIMQDFIDLDKKGFLNSLGQEIWHSICDGRALVNPEQCLSRFGLLVYADLKKYNYFYWFTYPAINYPLNVFQSNLTLENNSYHPQAVPILSILDEALLGQLKQQYDSSSDERTFQRGYFIVAIDNSKRQLECLPLTEYQRIVMMPEYTVYFAFTDPSADTNHPGWPLRNYLSLITVQFKLNKIKLIRIRRGLTRANLDLQHSFIMEITCELNDDLKLDTQPLPQCPLVTGWEKNESHQMAPKRVNLSKQLDPKKLAEDAVNLNLRLMKWRLLPSLELDKIANTKCLLLGCGTLGCHIARGLLAWGVKYISLVDNSKISYSNPVRQSLYTFDDCLKSNKETGGTGIFKAEAAATSLRKIHPTVEVYPYVFSIPMPGHHIAENEVDQTKNDVSMLEKLIKNHDVTFLLMDTRESRWLPSVVALANQKLVINAAIGFDTFLLQRYGVRQYSRAIEQKEAAALPVTSTKKQPNQLSCEQLGCYFCNDIVAPGDSTIDRTLDQQCTVSRPGVSMMVSALAVELMASIVSSPKGSQIPAPTEIDTNSCDEEEEHASELGVVPHSIRGNLSRYHIYMPSSPSFNKCSACSYPVVNAYIEQGVDFLLKVFNDPSHLEEVAGLKDLQNVSDDVWALDSDELLFEEST